MAKFLANGAFVAVAALVGALITWAGTRVLFGEAPVGPLAAATAAWLVLGLALRHLGPPPQEPLHGILRRSERHRRRPPRHVVHLPAHAPAHDGRHPG